MEPNRRGYVFGYVDPDTDGVMSAIGYAELRELRDGDSYEPVVFGDLEAETEFVLEQTDLSRPRRLGRVSTEAPLALVDTHHPSQLPTSIDLENVEEVIDHHPGGSIAPFANARTQNEAVGAAATLVAERFREAGIHPRPAIATGLAAAIISNTLDFAAPTTTDRDRDTCAWLRTTGSLSEGFVNEMFSVRSDITGVSTADVLGADCRRFRFGQHHVGLSQLETTDLQRLLDRGNLLESMQTVRDSQALDLVVFVGVDIQDEYSVLAATGGELAERLGTELETDIVNSFASFDEVILRKTHVLPTIEKLFDDP